mgnify:CR=1 FL=1
MKKIYLAFLFACVCTALIAQTILTPTDAGSTVHFTIKNFGLKTSGDFTGLKGAIKFDPNNLAGSSFDITVDANSVNTGNKSRDNHLRKEEYFDVAKYPVLHFKSTKVNSIKEIYFVEGTITIKSIIKVISFPFKASPQDGGGFLFQGLFELNRRDFGVGGNSAVLGDNVKVTLTVFAK